ncbi:NACHT domain-containing protein [Allokutzneria albata]|uniref:NACHT N-terminal Helical domain-containing protein n=1 Tax=Allokutzneria albata TaxID=211114 RepID=A0A1G9RU77_ALLAB|nr:ATP-binding protein [Allokutzneria albata]SDM26781.1 hypothetical protein SAMN04489726_0688 [Allokutzneria albata]
MRREPAITFRGALQILGHHDRPWLDRLNSALGGVVLASGALPPVNALWGWVDQKNEAMTLTRRALDSVSDRVNGSHGLERHQLVVAAHTTMVMASFFEVVTRHLPGVELTEGEKVMLATGEWQQEGESLVRQLYAADVPAPSAVFGFAENVHRVAEWGYYRLQEVYRFLRRLSPDFSRAVRRMIEDEVHEHVARRYYANFLTMATTVHEFKVWSDLVEHAATRSALERLEKLLSVAVQQTRDLRAVVRAINHSELDRPVIELDSAGYGFGAVFPSVADIFRTPHFRLAQASKESWPADENWWSELPQYDDLDLVLARHFSSTASTSLPLLLLGHPGAGKSLLTKVLAARLPDSGYTVVRVPLRQVDADVPVVEQIQQALHAATNRRVDWADLADQSEDVIRVVLLDGLDELLQATTNDRGGYLREIQDFQRIEAACDRPVAVVVTSRTLVADRVRIPDGTPMVKLDEFDDDQIAEWISVWNRSNRPMPLETALAHGELARQPLLLLMLTLYFTDPETPATDAELSQVDLYDRLFDTYARREAKKDPSLPERGLPEAVGTQLRRLSTAALGMFNRGRQSITEAELSADLKGLKEPSPQGERLLGEFFFVHSAEAVTSSVQRSYEFLHATFNEHLVAARIVEELRDVAAASLRGRRFREPDDALLFALLSHQPLAIQQPTLEFVLQRLLRLDDDERDDVIKTVGWLLEHYRRRHPAQNYPDYRPLPPDVVRPIAAYSANLVLLRVVADPDVSSARDLWPDSPETWPSTVNLWSAGLDAQGFRAMLSNQEGTADLANASVAAFDQLSAARLREDEYTERRLRIGHAVLDGLRYYYDDRPDTWRDYYLSVLLSVTTSVPELDLSPVPDGVPLEDASEMVLRAYALFGRTCPDMPRESVRKFLTWLVQTPTSAPPVSAPFLLAEHVHRGVLREIEPAVVRGHWRNVIDAVLAADEPADLSVTADYLAEVNRIESQWMYSNKPR